MRGNSIGECFDNAPPQDDATRQRLQQLHSCSHSGSQGSGGGGGGKKGASSSVVALEMSGDDPSGKWLEKIIDIEKPSNSGI